MPNPLIPFNYRIIRSKRKSLGLYVKNNEIEARAPYWVDEQEILSFLQRKKDWCIQKLDEQGIRTSQAPTFEDGTQCLFFGETRTIECHAGKPNIVEKNEKLHVFHRQSQDSTPSKHSSYLRQWMRKEAQQYLFERCIELEKICQPLNPITAIQFRKTKSKWGHCTSKGEIQLNWLLIMAPPEVMDYVIIHEICHLTHMNHSSVFWQLVSQLCPNYKEQKQWLSDHGHRISF